MLDEARSISTRMRRPFRSVVNEALRVGLKAVAHPASQAAFRTQPHRMGLKEGLVLDNIQELLAQIEGESAR